MNGTILARARLSGVLDINVAIGFAFGVLFLSIMLAFAVLYPNPSPFQIHVFVTTLALSAAGVGGVFAGKINVKYKNVLSAGGAISLFAIVFLFRSALELNVVALVKPTTSPEPVAAKYFSAIDTGNVDKAWQELDPIAHGTVVRDLETYKRLYETARQPLGAVVTRQLVGTSYAESPSGAPVGVYVSLSYRTKFQSAPDCRQEAVMLRATQELEWLVYAHQISMYQVPCQ